MSQQQIGRNTCDLQCWSFLSVVGSKFKFFSHFFMIFELQYHKLVYIDDAWFISSHGETAAYEHFVRHVIVVGLFLSLCSLFNFSVSVLGDIADKRFCLLLRQSSLVRPSVRPLR